MWIRDEVKSQPLLFLNQLVFGCLEAYFQFKIGVKSGDTDLMMAGLIQGEKIFFSTDQIVITSQLLHTG